MDLHLCVLDEYAKRLSDSQVKKLYEHVNGKSYKKALFEKDNKKETMKLYLNQMTTLDNIDAYNAELVMHLNENYASVMENVKYHMNEGDLEFTAPNRKAYSDLLTALNKTGFSKEVLKVLKDKKY